MWISAGIPADSAVWYMKHLAYERDMGNDYHYISRPDCVWTGIDTEAIEKSLKHKL